MASDIQKYKLSSIFSLIAIGVLVSGGLFFVWQPFSRSVLIAPAYAEDDEEVVEEYEDEGEYDNKEYQSTSSKASKVKSTPIYKKVLVTKIITTLDPIFTTDQDGDKLVDGLDPHPTVPEQEYFTDADGDSVPDAFDRHPDEDDFAYYEEESDVNGNGILDSYELLEKR